MTDKATNQAAEAMPDVIYATPRGSGTISGVYVDLKLGDEERGEHKYIRADLCQQKDIPQEVIALAKSTRNMLQACAHDLLDKSAKERKSAFKCVLEYIAKFDKKFSALAALQAYRKD